MHLEEQLRRRLDTIRESIRAKYKSMPSAQRPNDPIRKYLAGEIEKELDEIVQVQTRIDRIRPDAGPMRPSVVDRSNPTLFAELQDEYHFLQRLLD
jgi:chaperonin cofactor prefoldin